jgi:hypothetical protein
MRLILEFHNKGHRGTVWIHYANTETEVFDGHIAIALEVYEHLKRYAMERSGLPDYSQQGLMERSRVLSDEAKSGFILKPSSYRVEVRWSHGRTGQVSISCALDW